MNRLFLFQPEPRFKNSDELQQQKYQKRNKRLAY